MTAIRIEQLEPSVVNNELAHHLQLVALNAWSRSLPNRTPEELQHQFDPFTLQHIKKVQAIYQKFANEGGLFVATTREAGISQPIGFLLLHEDVSGDPLSQAYKRRFHPGKVYAHAQHLVVDTPWQRQGIGMGLLHHGLSTSVEQETFRLEQTTTAYIFEENNIAKAGIEKAGYRMDPPDQKPSVIEDYFGADAAPVEEYRYARMIAAVLDATGRKAKTT